MDRKLLTTGLHKAMDEIEYRAHQAVAHSDLKNMNRSPAYARHVKLHGDTGSKAKSLGTAMHFAVLEPSRFADKVGLDLESPKGGYPKGWRNSKPYKEWRAQQPVDKLLLDREQWDAVPTIIDNLRNDEIGRQMFEVMDGTEFSCFAWDPEFDLARKCRPDLLASRARMVVDLKTYTQPKGDVKEALDLFERDALKFGYYTGAAYYLDTLELADQHFDHYAFTFVNLSPPYEVNSFTLDEDSMAQGRFDYRVQLRRYADCLKSGVWPAGTGHIREARIPQFAIDYHERDEEDV